MRPLPVAIWVAVLVVSSLPAFAQNDDDLSTIRAELERLRAESEHLTAEYQAAWAADVELQARIDALQLSITAYGVDLRRLKDQIRERAVQLYMDGATGNDLATFLISPSPTKLEARSEYLRDLRQQDQAMFNNLEALTRQLEGFTEDLRREQQEQERTLALLEELAIDLNNRLEEGQAAYALLQQRQAEERARLEAEQQAKAEAEARAREAEAATTTTAAPGTSAQPTTTTAAPGTSAQPTTTTSINVTDITFANPIQTNQDEEETEETQPDGLACPVDGFSTFSDTWGAPRSGGRRHEGVDLLAARGTAVVAVESGFVERLRQGGLGGITVWLEGRSGDDYYYAHLDAWAPGLSVGQEVSVGQRLGIAGTTGNSPDHIPHLHWEYHPGGYVPGRGSAVNPTPLARQLCA